MKPKFVFFLSLKQENTDQYVENDIKKIKDYLKKNKVQSDTIHLIYTEKDFVQTIQHISTQIGNHEASPVKDMFPVVNHIVKNNLQYESSIFNKNCFSLFSKHNKKLVCNIVEQSIEQSIDKKSKNKPNIIILVVNQEYLNEEWPYNPHFLEIYKSRNNNSFNYSPIAINLQSQKITNL